MSNSAQDIRRRRLLAEKDNMARVEARRAGVQIALENAEHAYNAALAVMRELQAELDDINEEHLSATSRFQVVRDAYRRELATQLPDDVLRYIFEITLPIRENGSLTTWHRGSFGTCSRGLGDSALPFALACVCRRWREVALGLSALWSSINLRRTTPDHVERIALSLKRSKSAPLDVICYFKPDMADPDTVRALLDTLEEHTWRWDHAQQVFVGPASRVRMDELSVVRRQAPQLRRLLLHVEDAAADGGPLDPEQHCLQIGPHIVQLVLVSPWALHPKAPFVLPRLVSLFWCQPGAYYLWNILYAARDTLKEVVFATRSNGLPQLIPVTPPFTMGSLEELCIHGPAMSSVFRFNKLKAPRLQKLSILWLTRTSQMEPFFEAVSPSVKTLVLHGSPPPNALDVLSKLSNVERLVFLHVAKFFMVSYTISDEFFAGLSAPLDISGDAAPTWIWPQLSSISFSNGGSFEAGNGHNLRQLVRARTGRDRDDTSLPHRLASVVIEDKTSPKWLRDEIKLMLA